MNWLGTMLGTGVVGGLAAIAAIDARRMTIAPAWLLAVGLSGFGWLLAGGGAGVLERSGLVDRSDGIGGVYMMHLAGAAAGIGLPAAMIGVAAASGARWPIYPGDALLLGVVGAILGLKGLAWSMALGGPLALAHRVCVQRRRGRRVTAGYMPAGPGLAAGAALVFLAANIGAPAAQERNAGESGDAIRIEATELVDAKRRAPEGFSETAIELEVAEALPLRALLVRIGEAGGFGIAIEERPSRISDGAVELPEVAELALGKERRLGALLDDVAKRSGYAWEWRDGSVVFYRHWDVEWAGADKPADGALSDLPDPPGSEPLGAVGRWLATVFGAGSGERSLEEGLWGDTGEEAWAEGYAGEGEIDVGDGGQTAGAPGEVEPEAVEEAAVEPAEATTWEVIPEEQKTLRGVLEDWARKAEWKVAWNARRDFKVGAAAEFEGEFLAAVDSLLSDPRVSRVLVVRAYANRYLVIEGAAR